MTDNPTPLLCVLRELGTARRRRQFAALAGTSVGYLYQLAGCHRCRPRLDLGLQICEATKVLHKKYGTPVVSLETLATMCALPEGESE